MRIMRKHIGWYLKGMHGAAEMRRKINAMEDPEEVFAALDHLLSRAQEE